jgi:hypothetical protein
MPEYQSARQKYSNELETTPMINIMRDLRVFYEEQTSKKSKGGSHAMFGFAKKSQGKCFNCNQTGH